MTYNFEDIRKLLATAPSVHQRALQAGKLHPHHTHIELPDDFDFGPLPPPPVAPPPSSLRGHAGLAPVSIYSFGLGDLIYWLIHPFAWLSDRLFHTRLASCHACSARRAWLNRLASVSRHRRAVTAAHPPCCRQP